MVKRIPVTIVTGFLGSGKTTLLRHLILTSQKRLALVINEFGSVGLDGDLIRSCGFCPEEEIDGQLVELNNGCLCCTVQDDFLPTMNKLLDRSTSLDGIVIETSGLALPRPLLQAINWPAIKTKLFVNGVVTMVDGEALSKGSPVGDLFAIEQQRKSDPSIDHLTPLDELFQDQLEVADLVLVSKVENLSVGAIDSVTKQISLKIRDATRILPVSNGKVDSSLILGIGDVTTNFKEKEGSLLKEHKHDDHHHLEVESGVIRIEGNVQIDSLEKLLTRLSVEYQIIRLKGRCWAPEKTLPLQIQMVGPRFSSWFEEVPKGDWHPQLAGIELVVISFSKKAIDQVRSGIERECIKELN